MEIGENVEAKKETLHTTQSQPILLEGSNIRIEDDADKSKKSPKSRRVSFASSSQLAQYLEPINPFQSLAPISSSKELSNLYRKSCEKHKTQPIPTIIEHLETINLDTPTSPVRTEALDLKHETLSHESCEALEELFKRVKYRSIDLTSCSLDDVSATALFDMIEYYEACNELNISENSNIKNRGWQSCINMIKRSQQLHSLFTRGTPLNDSNASQLGNALLTSFIYTLKLENCNLSGHPILGLSGALERNKTLKELCLANNDLNHNDAYHIGKMLRNNYYLQLLDISNNDIQNEGFRHIAESLSYQSSNMNKTSSDDSLSSSIKFDFSDLTANLNNINNNRQRFSPSPTPKIEIPQPSDADGSSAASSVNNNNNSILQCDNDKRESDGSVQKPAIDSMSMTDESDMSSKDENETAQVAIRSTKSAIKAADEPKKFQYTTASLSPISHGYDDTTTNHQLFNARSPERSFSSESLCSETSIESNDSKSSIRLIETKFSNKNGTLERQQSSSVTQTAARASESRPSGLQVLILWNNNLTPKCSACAYEMLDSSENLQIINFGQNRIGNEFLMNIKPALKTNKSLISLGLQASEISCDGLKILSETIQFGGNSTLQRIDLRNNEISIAGLRAISDALISNRIITRIDLDETPKNIMLPMFDHNAEYQRWISTIRQQCAHNENPPEPSEPAKATSTVQRMKRSNYFSSGRKISLTCQSVKVIPPPKSVDKQLLDPAMKKPSGRLRSPSPTSSPATSPLPSPSRSRFQVSRVSESSSGVGSSKSSPSPSSGSASPTFFPLSNSRFRVVTVTEAPKKVETPSEPVAVEKLIKSESKPEPSHVIDIPIIKPPPLGAPPITHTTIPTSFLNISNSSILSSQSCEQLDYEVKKYIDLDSCSSFSSSIDSIDHPTDMSSTESFDLIEKSSAVETPVQQVQEVMGKETTNDGDKKDIFSNENTLVSTSSSSSSNEGLTLTTNSPTSDLSPKQEAAQKRVRKTSYPATLDKLLNLFHHPSSIFTKTSPESTLASSPSGSCNVRPPKHSVSNNEKLSTIASSGGSKESPLSGFIQSLVSLTHKKEVQSSCSASSILQNISPENTVQKSSNPQLVIENLPKSVKLELKENISPENTISSDNLQQKPPPLGSSKVTFVVGEGSIDLPDTCDESIPVVDDEIVSDEIIYECKATSLGEITRDSMSILKSKLDDGTIDDGTKPE